MKDLKNYLAKYQTDGVVKTLRQLTKFAGVSKEETVKELDRLEKAEEIAYTLLDRLPGGPFVFLTYAKEYDQAVLLMPDVDIHTEDQPWAAQVFNLLSDYEDLFSYTQDNVNRYNAMIFHYFEYYKNSVLFDPAMVDLSGGVDPVADDPGAEGPDQSLELPLVELEPLVTIELGAVELGSSIGGQFCFICQQEAILDRRLCANCTEKVSDFVRYPVAWLIDPNLITNAVYVELIRQYRAQN